MTKRLPLTSFSDSNFTALAAEHETPQLTKTEAGFSVFYGGKNLYPANPEAATRTKARSLVLEENTLYVLGSPLLWYGVDELIDALPGGSLLLICELDTLLRDLVDWSEKREAYQSKRQVRVVTSCDPNSILAEMNRSFGRKIRRIRSLSLNAARLIHATEYQDLQLRAEELLQQHWRNTSTTLFMGPLWIRNILANCLTRSDDITRVVKNDHVVVCGAGPSLETSIPLLRSYRDRIFLIAVDTALPTLHSFGLRPDLVVVVESQIANLKDFVPCGGEHRAIAYDISSSPTVLHSVKFSRTYVFSSDFAPGAHWQMLSAFKLLPTQIPPLGSVGVSALYLCSFFARISVAIIGLDFSWSPGLSHARGSPNHLNHLVLQARLKHGEAELGSLSPTAYAARGISETHLVSDKLLDSYARSANEVAAFLKSSGLSVFDLRDRGLPLESSGAEADWIHMFAEAGTRIEEDAFREVAEDDADPQGFLECLSQQISDCIFLVEEWLAVPREDSRALLESIDNLDFLFYDVPDREWPSTEPHALARALANLYYFRQRAETMRGTR